MCSGFQEKPSAVGRHHEQRDALVLLGIWVGARGQPDVVGELGTAGEHLRPVDDVVVAVAHRGGAQRREIATGARFGVADGEVDGALEDGGKELVLLLVGAELDERGTDRVQRDHRQRCVDPPRLFTEDVLLQRGQPAAAVLDRPGDAEQPGLAECAPALADCRPALGGHGHGGPPLGRHDCFEASPVVLAKPLLFWGVVEIHELPAPNRTGIFLTPGVIVARKPCHVADEFDRRIGARAAPRTSPGLPAAPVVHRGRRARRAERDVRVGASGDVERLRWSVRRCPRRGWPQP